MSTRTPCQAEVAEDLAAEVDGGVEVQEGGEVDASEVRICT